jgi:ABC-type multidrug transport system fused ATPase/permease subunit
MGFILETPFGKLQSTIGDRVESLENALAHLLPELTANIFWSVAIISYLFVFDWRMALISMITFPLGYLCIRRMGFSIWPTVLVTVLPFGCFFLIRWPFLTALVGSSGSVSLGGIRMGNLHATDEEVGNAAKVFGCQDFILKLENGYDTVVGGEHQRIAIAHRLSTVTDSDKLVVVKDGQIKVEGTHGQLLEKCTLYRNISEHVAEEEPENV